MFSNYLDQYLGIIADKALLNIAGTDWHRLLGNEQLKGCNSTEQWGKEEGTQLSNETPEHTEQGHGKGTWPRITEQHRGVGSHTRQTARGETHQFPSLCCSPPQGMAFPGAALGGFQELSLSRALPDQLRAQPWTP